MSKLQSAKSAITAEIIHAKQGLAYYQSRIEVLEQTLAQLDSVMDLESSPKRQAIKPKKTNVTVQSKARRVKRHAIGENNISELPSTAGDYWINLITDQPQSAPEILKSAINSLGFTPNDAQVRKLRQRLTAALQTLIQSKKIQDSGSRRERRFFKST